MAARHTASTSCYLHVWAGTWGGLQQMHLVRRIHGRPQGWVSSMYAAQHFHRPLPTRQGALLLVW